MPRHVRYPFSLPLFLLVLFALSCSERPATEALEPIEVSVAVVPPPYRMVLVTPRTSSITAGLPEGMVSVLNSGNGRLNSTGFIWKSLVDLAEDETVRAVVVADAPQGTAALFAELKEQRPELLLLALTPAEAPLVIQAAADIVVDFDHVTRAYSAVLLADRMKHRTIISLSMPGDDDDWRLNVRQAVLRMACTDMGLSFRKFAISPDGLEKVLRELEQGIGAEPGKSSDAGSGMDLGRAVSSGAVLVVNDGRLAPGALRMATVTGSLFVELDRPEQGYDGSQMEAGLSGGLSGDDPVRTLIDSARSVPGRPGLTLVWPGEQAGLLESGVLAFAKSIVDGKPASEQLLAAAMNGVWPAGQWHSSHYVDSQTGVRARNHFLTGADAYLIGRSYLSSESRSMPVEYRQAADR